MTKANATTRPVPPAPPYSAMPAATDVVHRYLLERNAKIDPDQLAVRFDDGTSWTATQARDEAYRAGNRLWAAGVRQQTVVGVALPNGPDFLRAWWGIASLGAIMVPMNLAWTGRILNHSLRTADPMLVIAYGEFADRVQAESNVALLGPAELVRGALTPPPLDRPIEVWDIHHLQFTSGTTGPSKASRNSIYQFYVTGSWATVDVGLDENDCFLIDLPMFHQASFCMAGACLATRTPIAVRTVPSLANYWQVAKETGATVTFLLSTMVPYLTNRPPDPADRDHRVRLMLSAPLPTDPQAFCERFGVRDIITAYGSSEVSATTVTRPGEPPISGVCGRVRPGWIARIVDDNDMPVPTGVVGELVVRTLLPWSTSSGYVGDEVASAAAYRNGWFHTGDLLRTDEHGYFYFIDRKKDAIRRRGENISTYEVEADVLAHPAIAEVACVAVPGLNGVEDEVKVWLILEPNAELDEHELVVFLAAQMPHYMVPRYYEIVTELPKTQSLRVQKNVLRERGNSAQTWDLEANGFKMTRTGLRAIDVTGAAPTR